MHMLRSLTSAALALCLFASCGGGQSGGLAAPSDLMAKELLCGAPHKSSSVASTVMWCSPNADQLGA